MTGLLVFVLVSAVIVYLWLDRILGWLVAWIVGRTPKAYRWSIEKLNVRTSLKLDSQVWFDVTFVNWTWHNPVDFTHHEDEDTSYLLQIDRLMIRLDLASIFRTIRKRGALKVDLLQAEGVRFRAKRNYAGAMNLWECINVPDADVNVSVLVQRAQHFSGANEPIHQEPEAETVRPLAAVATQSTRAAAKYWRPEWGDRDDYDEARYHDEHGHGGCLGWMKRSHHMDDGEEWGPDTLPGWDCNTSLTAGASCNLTSPLLHSDSYRRGHYYHKSRRTYKEYPIGHPRRRPRWGLPFRLDVRRAVILDAQFWIFDLLTLSSHESSDHPSDTKFEVPSLIVTRNEFEGKDPRRKGGGDGVHGVFLGELVWVLIAQLVPILAKQSPLHFGADVLRAGVAAVKDMGARVEARAFESVLHMGRTLKDEVKSILRIRNTEGANHSPSACLLKVRLVGGKKFTLNGESVNVRAELQLHDPPAQEKAGDLVDCERSDWQMFTKEPSWNQSFTLGAVHSLDSVLRIECVHKRAASTFGVHLPGHDSSEDDFHIGEVNLPLSQLVIQDKALATGGEIVGWFPLTHAHGQKGKSSTAGGTGQLKLGIKLENVQHLRPQQSQGQGHHEDGPPVARDADDPTPDNISMEVPVPEPNGWLCCGGGPQKPRLVA